YVDFKGHVTDESALTDLKLDGQDLEHAFNNRTGAWEFSGKMPVKDGLNEFKILANDKAGNLIEFRQAFFVDLYAPVLSIDSKRTQFKRQGDTYYVRLNGYVSDTFPMLQLKVGKNL
ncbi:S8 family serine peptidase, partial [Aduncisulcus paluster]